VNYLFQLFVSIDLSNNLAFVKSMTKRHDLITKIVAYCSYSYEDVPVLSALLQTLQL